MQLMSSPQKSGRQSDALRSCVCMNPLQCVLWRYRMVLLWTAVLFKSHSGCLRDNSRVARCMALLYNCMVLIWIAFGLLVPWETRKWRHNDIRMLPWNTVRHVKGSDDLMTNQHCVLLRCHAASTIWTVGNSGSNSLLHRLLLCDLFFAQLLPETMFRLAKCWHQTIFMVNYFDKPLVAFL